MVGDQDWILEQSVGILGSTCIFCALTVLILVIPSTKHIASRIFDFPLPLRPVMELKVSSHPPMTVRTAYDLKPSMTSSMILILALLD